MSLDTSTYMLLNIGNTITHMEEERGNLVMGLYYISAFLNFLHNEKDT